MTDSLYNIAGISPDEVAQLDQMLSINKEALETLITWFARAVDQFGGDTTQAVVLTQATLAMYDHGKLAVVASTALLEVHRLREKINGQRREEDDPRPGTSRL